MIAGGIGHQSNPVVNKRKPIMSNEPNNLTSLSPSTAPKCDLPWRIRIDDGYCEYEYVLRGGADDVSIHDLYELVRQKLGAEPCEGKYLGPMPDPNAPEPVETDWYYPDDDEDKDNGVRVSGI